MGKGAVYVLQSLVFVVPPQAEGRRLGVFLRQAGVSASCIKAVKHQGRGFFADDAPLHTDQPVHAGQTIRFDLPPEPSTSVTPQPVPFTLVYESDFAAVVDKPAGLAVHPTLNHTDGTLANGWLYHLQRSGRTGVFRPTNRLDKNTSGLMLLAQNAYAAPGLADSARKCYLALVQGELPPGPGSIDAPLGRRGIPSSGGACAPTASPAVPIIWCWQQGAATAWWPVCPAPDAPIRSGCIWRISATRWRGFPVRRCRDSAAPPCPALRCAGLCRTALRHAPPV